MNVRTQGQAHLIHVKHECMALNLETGFFFCTVMIHVKHECMVLNLETGFFFCTVMNSYIHRFQVKETMHSKERDCNFAHVYLLWAAPKQSGISDLNITQACKCKR